MKVIWKFPIHRCEKRKMLLLPRSAEILAFRVQKSGFALWALLDKDEATESRTFLRVLTGEKIELNAGEFLSYIGTAQRNWCVLHLFEIKKSESKC